MHAQASITLSSISSSLQAFSTGVFVLHVLQYRRPLIEGARADASEAKPDHVEWSRSIVQLRQPGPKVKRRYLCVNRGRPGILSKGSSGGVPCPRGILPHTAGRQVPLSGSECGKRARVHFVALVRGANCFSARPCQLPPSWFLLAPFSTSPGLDQGWDQGTESSRVVSRAGTTASSHVLCILSSVESEPNMDLDQVESREQAGRGPWGSARCSPSFLQKVSDDESPAERWLVQTLSPWLVPARLAV